MSNLAKLNPSTTNVRPWYKEFYVWMVIAGPVSAVLACAVTAVYIFQGPDAVVSENYYKEGLALEKEVGQAQPAMQPAKTGRNHSATGGVNHDKP
jgi:hypothetical protein